MLAGSLSLQSLKRCLCYLAQLVLVLQQVPIPDRGSSAADSELVKLGSEDYAWFCRGGLIVKLYDALHQLHVLLSQVLPSQLVEVVVKQSVARREWRRGVATANEDLR